MYKYELHKYGTSFVKRGTKNDIYNTQRHCFQTRTEIRIRTYRCWMVLLNFLLMMLSFKSAWKKGNNTTKYVRNMMTIWLWDRKMNPRANRNREKNYIFYWCWWIGLFWIMEMRSLFCDVWKYRVSFNHRWYLKVICVLCEGDI